MLHTQGVNPNLGFSPRRTDIAVDIPVNLRGVVVVGIPVDEIARNETARNVPNSAVPAVQGFDQTVPEIEVIGLQMDDGPRDDRFAPDISTGNFRRTGQSSKILIALFVFSVVVTFPFFLMVYHQSKSSSKPSSSCKKGGDVSKRAIQDPCDNAIKLGALSNLTFNDKSCMPEYGFNGNMILTSKVVNQMYPDWNQKKADGIDQRLYFYLGIPGEGLFSIGKGVSYPRLGDPNSGESLFITEQRDGSFLPVPIAGKGSANVYIARTNGTENPEDMVMGYGWNGAQRGSLNDTLNEYGSRKLGLMVESLGLDPKENIKLIRRTGKSDGNPLVIDSNQGTFFISHSEGRNRGPFGGHFSKDGVELDCNNNLKLSMGRDGGIDKSVEVEIPSVGLANGDYRIVIEGRSQDASNVFGGFAYSQYAIVNGFPKEVDFTQEGFHGNKEGQVVIQPRKKAGHLKKYTLGAIQSGDVRTYVATVTKNGTEFWLAPGYFSIEEMKNKDIKDKQHLALFGVDPEFNYNQNDIRAFTMNLCQNWRIGYQAGGPVEERTILAIDVPCATEPDPSLSVYNLPECPREDILACPAALDECRVENFKGSLSELDLLGLIEKHCGESTQPCHGDKLNACADPAEVGPYGRLNAILAIHRIKGGNCPPYFKKGANCESSNFCNIDHKSIRNAQGLYIGPWPKQKLYDFFNWICEQLAEENIDCANDECPTLASLVDNALWKMEKSSWCPA